MIFELVARNNSYAAKAEINLQTRTTIVLKGAKISERISLGSFRSAKSVEKLRLSGCIKDGVLQYDLSFKSPSTAANFVTGTSTNGMLAWKNEEGKNLKSLI